MPRHGHRFFERTKFLRTYEVFVEKGAVQKKTIDGGKKWIVQRNKIKTNEEKQQTI